MLSADCWRALVWQMQAREGGRLEYSPGWRGAPKRSEARSGTLGIAIEINGTRGAGDRNRALTPTARESSAHLVGFRLSYRDPRVSLARDARFTLGCIRVAHSVGLNYLTDNRHSA
jgi:hypothetical protein